MKNPSLFSIIKLGGIRLEQTLLQQHQVKEVNFEGDSLLAATHNDKVYVAVTAVCAGIGLTRAQKDRQLKNIHQDIVLSQGTSNLTLPTNGGPQNVLVMEIEFLPLWLAKISITPKMKEDSPAVVEKLVNYQLKAKDVLAAAFIRPKTSAELLLAQAEMLVETERRLSQIEEVQRHQVEVVTQQQQQLTTMIDMFSETPIRSRIVRKVKELARHRNTTVQEAWHEIYWVLNDKYGIDLKRRIQNKRNRMNKERLDAGLKPYSESYLKQKVNALDVIMEEEMGQEVMEVIAGRMVRG